MDKRTNKQRRDENYKTTFKFAVALAVMLVLVGIATILTK